MMSESLHQLRALPDDELIKRHDNLAPTTAVGTRYYLDELNRREQIRQTDVIRCYTKWITYMTIVITIATVVGVFFSSAMLVLNVSDLEGTWLTKV